MSDASDRICMPGFLGLSESKALRKHWPYGCFVYVLFQMQAMDLKLAPELCYSAPPQPDSCVSGR